MRAPPRPLVAALALLGSLAACASAPTVRGDAATTDAARATELAEARALFLRNIEAIQRRDREAYLACYRDDADLVRAGNGGVELGFEGLATKTPTTGSTAWPERLDADRIELHWLAPGVVYGAYAYRVVIAGQATKGLSERVFLRTPLGWRIAVSTAFAHPPKPTP